MEKTNLPLVSVIVPVYNVEKYLNKCIDSILCQSYENIELILVDDGSPDACGNICDNYQKKDSRVIVIHKENGGLSSARNKGIEIAKGDFISFVDSDDYINPDMIRIMFEAIMRYEADIAFCNYIHVDENGNQVGISELRIKEPEVLCSETLLENISRGWTFGAIAWNKLYKRDIFKSIRYPEGMISEDEFVAHRVLSEVKRAVILPDVLYFYTLRQGSITKSAYSMKQLGSIYALIDRTEFMQSLGKNNLAFHSLFLAIKKLTIDWKHRKDSIEIEKTFDSLRAELLKKTESVKSREAEIKYRAAVWMFVHSFPVLRLILSVRF